MNGNGKMTKAEAGRLGGSSTFKKYGSSHMSELGRKGAKSLHEKYDLVPWGLNDFALVCKESGNIVNTLSGVFRWNREYKDLENDKNKEQ